MKMWTQTEKTLPFIAMLVHPFAILMQHRVSPSTFETEMSLWMKMRSRVNTVKCFLIVDHNKCGKDVVLKFFLGQWNFTHFSNTVSLVKFFCKFRGRLLGSVIFHSKIQTVFHFFFHRFSFPRPYERRHCEPGAHGPHGHEPPREAGPRNTQHRNALATRPHRHQQTGYYQHRCEDVMNDYNIVTLSQKKFRTVILSELLVLSSFFPFFLSFFILHSSFIILFYLYRNYRSCSTRKVNCCTCNLWSTGSTFIELIISPIIQIFIIVSIISSP